MLVYDSFVVGGMVFPSYGNGFQPSIFLDAMVCWDVYFGFGTLELLDGFHNMGRRSSQG